MTIRIQQLFLFTLFLIFKLISFDAITTNSFKNHRGTHYINQKKEQLFLLFQHLLQPAQMYSFTQHKNIDRILGICYRNCACLSEKRASHCLKNEQNICCVYHIHCLTQEKRSYFSGYPKHFYACLILLCEVQTLLKIQFLLRYVLLIELPIRFRGVFKIGIG